MRERGSKNNKIIDKYLGIPILVLLGLIKSKKSIPFNIQTAAVILTPAIGDALLLQGLFKDMKKELKAEVTVFSPKSTLDAVKLCGYYDHLVEIDLFNPIETLKKIRSKNYDVFIDSGQWTRITAIYTALSKSNYKIGFNTSGQYKHYAFDKRVIHSNKIHEIYNYKNLIYKNNYEDLPEIILDNKQIVNKTAAIHITPGGYLSYLKEYPNEYWKVVIEYLLSKGYKIYFSGSKNDYEKVEELLKLLEKNSNLVNAAGKMNLIETAELLNKMELVISVNTGIMHLASLLKCNLVALHGPTNVLRWGPLNKNSAALSADYPCAPCLNLGFEYKCTDRTGECMKTIKPEQVISAIESLLINADK